MTSLRHRLVMTLLGGLLVGGSLAAAGLYWQSIEEINEQFDDRLRSIASSLTAETVTSASLLNESVDDQKDDDIVVQVWNADGSLRVHTDPGIAPFPPRSGLTDLDANGQAWRSYARAGSNGSMLQVAQATKTRQRLAAETALQLLLPLLALLPVLALLTGWAVSRQLRPLRQLAEQMNQRDANHQGRVAVSDTPTELIPVIKALNDLLQRQAEASEQQRAFLADAAHELRTPLAVVSLQSQRAQRAASDADRREALKSLQSGVDRATRLVTQLLGLARSDRGASEPAQIRPLSFDELLRHTLAELHPLAADKSIDLGLTHADACHMQGDADALRSLIANLIDNAIRYTPAGGRIDVSLVLDGGQALLSVRDSGPGIPVDRRDQLFCRFVRAGNADTVGSGLGLAIARQVAERHGGDIAMEDAEAGVGLAVRVRLPATASVA